MKIESVFLTEAEHVRADQWMFGLSIENEEWVSSLGLIEYQMRFGSAYLKMGGIRAVGTREAHRNKGYSRRVMEAAITFMTENGFDVSMLFGISNFYHKFGYATVIPEIWIDFRREEAQAAVPCDIGFQTETIFETIVHFLVDRAKRIGVSQLLCHIPIDHPFAIFCRRYDCRTHIRNWKDSGGMMRIINQSSTLEKITGELEKRLQRDAELSEWSGKLLISTDLGQDCLEIDHGSVAYTNNQTNGFHLEMPQDKLIQLVMGRRSIRDLAIEPDVSVSAEIIPVLEALFSLDYPHVWWLDRF